MSEVTFTVDPRVFRLTAVKKAAYRLGDRCHAQIDLLSDGRIQVKLTAKPGTTLPPALEGDFRNELLDQDLRETIAEETEKVRNLILAHAFSGLSMNDDIADYRDDPLGIAGSRPEGR